MLKLRLGGGVMSAFVFPLTAIARAPSFDVLGSIALGKAHKHSDYTAVIAIMH